MANERRTKKRLLNRADDGQRATIFKWFWWPLFATKHDTVNTRNFLEETIFHLSEREINTYRARRAFKMPGLLRTTPTSAVQGIGYRWVHKDAKFFVRSDSTMPDLYEVETYIGTGRAETHFVLTAEQWRQIARNHLSPSKFKQIADGPDED